MMTPEIQQAATEDIQKYLELKDQADSLDVQITTIRMNIQGYMDQSGVEQLTAKGYGKFVLETKRSWTYDVDITKIEDELKELKKKAQQVGAATSKEDKFIKFYEEKSK